MFIRTFKVGSVCNVLLLVASPGQPGEVYAQAQNKTCLKVTQRDLFAILISGLNLVNSFFSSY